MDVECRQKDCTADADHLDYSAAGKMTSYFSPDLFLEDIHLVVIFLNDGLVVHIPAYDSAGRIHESGDLLQLDRNQDVDNGRKSKQAAVILRWGECEADAISQARNYFKRLARWHGHERPSEFKILGHSVVESQYFEDIDEAKGVSFCFRLVTASCNVTVHMRRDKLLLYLLGLRFS